MTAPGLERMRDRTPEGLCPFCEEPLKGRRKRHCGDPACETAYHRTYQRDRRAGNLVARQRTETGRSSPCGPIVAVEGGFVVGKAYPHLLKLKGKP